MELDIGSVKLPINAATKSFAILAKRGAGKTYLGGVMAEEFFKASIPFVVFDPIDVWYGLRLKANGKDKGLPVVVFGVKHADIPLNRDMGRDIARAIVRDNISCVISTFGMSKKDMRHVVGEFADELLIINNTPRHVFVEEAHEYVPQRIQGGAGVVFSRVEALITMGRNRSIGVTMLNQRAATINKDVLTQIDTLMALRSVGPQDRKAISDWVDFHGAKEDVDEFVKSLPTLPTGTGWIWSPEFMGIFEKFKIRKRETFHPDPEKIGSTFVVPELAAEDIQSFITRFTTQIQNAKQKQAEPKKGSRKAADREVLPPAPPPVDRSAEIALRNEYESKIIQKDTRIRQLEGFIASAVRVLSGGTGIVAEVGSMTVDLDMGVPDETNMVLQKLGGMPRKMYEKLLQHPRGLTARQLALMCGYSISGSFRNARAKLKTMGLIKYEGDTIVAMTR